MKNKLLLLLLLLFGGMILGSCQEAGTGGPSKRYTQVILKNYYAGTDRLHFELTAESREDYHISVCSFFPFILEKDEYEKCKSDLHNLVESDKSVSFDLDAFESMTVGLSYVGYGIFEAVDVRIKVRTVDGTPIIQRDSLGNQRERNELELQVRFLLDTEVATVKIFDDYTRGDF